METDGSSSALFAGCNDFLHVALDVVASGAMGSTLFVGLCMSSFTGFFMCVWNSLSTAVAGSVCCTGGLLGGVI